MASPVIKLAGLLALSQFMAGTATGAERFDPARYIPLAMTVLKVEAPSLGGRMNVGTAITVAPGVVVTNCHVTRDATSIRVVKKAGQWPAVGQFADLDHDLCFLAVPAWRGTPVMFADPASLHLYQDVVAMGFTRGAEMSLSPGEITGLHRHDGGRIIQSTTSFSSGASGGALLDAWGRLVGVLTFRLRGNIEHYFSIPAAWILTSLPLTSDRFQPIGPLAQGKAFWERDSCCTPYFMRASSMRSRSQWADLLALSEEWLRADPDDADAWFARGLAQSRLQQSREAMSALARATELAPNHADAWFELGIASLEARDAAAAERARDALAGMGSKLAGKLQHMMR